MIDQYGRTIEYLRISVTDRCNLRCVYCMPEEGIEQLPHEQILTFDEIERVCRISTELGISKIKLTGGEPLVRKGLPDLLGKIKRIPGIEQVTLTTNGILLKNQLDELMRQGLDAVNISIDTLDETCYHTVTRCGELNQALEGLQAALEYPNLRVKLNCVPINPILPWNPEKLTYSAGPFPKCFSYGSAFPNAFSKSSRSSSLDFP